MQDSGGRHAGGFLVLAAAAAAAVVSGFWIRKLNGCSTSWGTAFGPIFAGAKRMRGSASRTATANSMRLARITSSVERSARPVESTTYRTMTLPSTPSLSSAGGYTGAALLGSTATAESTSAMVNTVS